MFVRLEQKTGQKVSILVEKLDFFSFMFVQKSREDAKKDMILLPFNFRQNGTHTWITKGKQVVGVLETHTSLEFHVTLSFHGTK